MLLSATAAILASAVTTSVGKLSSEKLFNLPRIHMNQKTGLTQLINFYDLDSDAFTKKKHPILWHFESQITGDSIHLISNSKNETLDSLKVFNNAFVINKDSLGEGYNQISGKRLNGLFVNNALETIDVIKNAETIINKTSFTGSLSPFGFIYLIFIK